MTTIAEPASVEADTVSTTGDPDSATEAFERWRDRSKGVLATYTAQISCMCSFGGTYEFAELDGELVEVRPIESDEGLGYPELWTLTAALRQASGSDGDFSIGETEDTLTIIADPVPGAIDDEWHYIATEIVLSEAPDVVPTGSWKWLDGFGAELAPHLMPDGWQVLDAFGLRFAVPGDWSIPLSASCAGTSPGAVLIRLGPDETTCNPAAAPATAELIIEPLQFENPGERVSVGDLTADRWMDPDCVTCAPIYRFLNGLQVTVSGEQTDAILSTFTDSGTVRVLQQGELADTADWQQIEYDGIGFDVPGDWQVRDFVDSNQQSSDANGNTNGVIGDPGTCGGGRFGRSDAQHVFLGNSPFQPPCAAPSSIDLSPNDAVWVRPAEREDVRVASGHVNGLDISVLFTDRYDRQQLDRSVELLVRGGDQPLRISLGVGLDSATARAILRSLHAT